MVCFRIKLPTQKFENQYASSIIYRSYLSQVWVCWCAFKIAWKTTGRYGFHIIRNCICWANATKFSLVDKKPYTREGRGTYMRNHNEASGGRFKNAYELLNLRALKFCIKNHIFQCMGRIFCLEFQMGTFEIPPKISHLYIEKYGFYSHVKI